MSINAKNCAKPWISQESVETKHITVETSEQYFKELSLPKIIKKNNINKNATNTELATIPAD